MRCLWMWLYDATLRSLLLSVCKMTGCPRKFLAAAPPVRCCPCSTCLWSATAQLALACAQAAQPHSRGISMQLWGQAHGGDPRLFLTAALRP